MGCGVPLGTRCHCAMPLASVWDGVGASSSARHCPSDDLGGCLGTWSYSCRKRAGGLFFGNLFSCQRGKLGPTFAFCPNLLCPEEGTCVQRSDGASWSLSHHVVLLEDVPKQAVAGGLCPTPGKLLVWVPWWRLQRVCVPSPADGTLPMSLCDTGCSATIHVSLSSLSSDLFTSIAAVWGSCSPRALSYRAGMML